MMLTHSVVSFLFVIAIIVFFTAFQIIISGDQTPTYKVILGALLINLTLSVFLGVYFAGGLQKLKQNYLWSINKKYKYTLLNAFLCLALIFNLLLLPVLYPNLKHMPLVLTLPFCVTVFSAYLVLGNNLLHRLLIPAIPLILIQLYRFNFSYNSIILSIIIATLILIVIMFLGNSYKRPQKQKSDTQKSIDSMNFATTGLSSKFVTNFNHILGKHLSKKLLKKGKNIDYAVIMPHSKLALFSLFYALLIIFAVLFVTHDGEKLIEAFSVLFLSTSLISLVMESRLLIRQTRTVAHLFKGTKHKQLKNNMLLALDKNIVFNAIVFILAILSLSYLFSISISTMQLSVITVLILSFALAFYPVLLCFQWVNISIQLILAICTYAAGIFLLLKNARSYFESENLMWYIIASLLVCILIRIITQTIFWHKPYEQLLKNK